MQTHETKDSDELYECKEGHQCRGKDIPEYGLDIYCPTCLKKGLCSPLDLIEQSDAFDALCAIDRVLTKVR